MLFYLQEKNKIKRSFYEIEDSVCTFYFFLPIYVFAVSPDISTRDVEFDFIVCEGDYIKIEVIADGADYSTVDFELNLPEKESQSFVFKQGTGVWNDYKVVSGENQYTL